MVNAVNAEKSILLDDAHPEDSILQKKIYFQLPGASDSLHAWVIFPPHFDSSQFYPVIFNVYGGPGSQEVVNTWHKGPELWMQYMAQQGYIIVSVDNRGTPGRGETFKKSTYLQLGKLEIEDQLAAVQYISKQWSFVNPNRIGIYGWSYGGYMTLLALTLGNGAYKAGVSIAPVTHWRFYDSVYTERFMRTPAENTKNYERTAPIALATKLQGELLLIHGVADDNVHFQHSLEMIKALNDAGKMYHFLAYPNKNHGISGKTTQYHLFKSVTEFFLEKL